MNETDTLQTPSVLLVEDHPFQLMGLAMQLNRQGFFRLGSALNCAEAMIMINEGRTFDLLLCDQHLPDGLGLDLIESIYRTGAIRYAILLSGIEDQPQLDQMLRNAQQQDLPILACLSKPLASDQFFHALKPLCPQLSHRLGQF
jgi:response regulator of citrate/malate metabolism